MKKITFLLLSLLVVSWTQAQTVYKNQVRVENHSVTKNKNNHLIITMDLVLQKNLKISSNRAAILTPLLQAEGHTKALPAVAVYGRRRAIVNERGSKFPKDAYRIVYRKRKTEQKVDYLVQIPYEAWMERAELTLSADLCGCCNVVEKGEENLLAQLDFRSKEVYLVRPALAYITPQVEAVKRRFIEGKAFLDFSAGKTIINSLYRNNPVELARICTIIDSVKDNKYVQLTGITIKGYASPEGSWATNTRLAQVRSEALKKYVCKLYHFNDSIFSVSSVSEDWEGLRAFVAQSDWKEKEELLAVIDTEGEALDAKEKRLTTVAGGVPYQLLLTQCYPALRHSDYTVRYTVRGFNLEESKELVYTRPQLLSLQEMFTVAQTYQAGSPEFNQIFSVAALMFPDDPIANLNASSIEIEKGDLEAAKRHLKKADATMGATLNNLGVIALLENNLSEAARYLNQAKEAGVLEADVNLLELEKKRENNQLMEE